MLYFNSLVVCSILFLFVKCQMFNKSIANLQNAPLVDVNTKFNSFLNRNLMYCNSAWNGACALACLWCSHHSHTVPKVARQQEVDKNQQHILLIAALAGLHPC